MLYSEHQNTSHDWYTIKCMYLFTGLRYMTATRYCRKKSKILIEFHRAAIYITDV
jgi:hypothetical protein